MIRQRTEDLMILPSSHTLVADIDNPVKVVVIASSMGHQKPHTTVLFSTVLVQFPVEIGICMFFSLSLSALFFISNMMRDNLHPIFIALAEDKAAFGPRAETLFLFKIGIWKAQNCEPC